MANEPESEGADQPRPAIRVLIVDNDREHAEAMRPGLIFLDVHLPDISGLEVCARLRNDPRFAATKIVMLTAAAQEADVARGLAAGANHYLTKPFSPVRLLSLVESVVPHAAVWRHE